jgi:signal transduction histidine kinase
VDPLLAQQAIGNLIMNAAEAAHGDGGRVVLATGSTPSAGGVMPYLEISDNGPGIASEAQQRVFDPFFSTKGRGRGLGLSVVQGVVQSHGGQIELTSAPQQGTTFRILLPAADTNRPANGPSKP